MSNNPREIIRAIEAKFEAHRKEPRAEFLRHFQDREFHFYIMITAELRDKYRPKAPYRAMIRKFPPSHWQEAILELIARFNKNREPDPASTGVENGISLVKAALAEFPEFFADNLDDLFVARIDFPGHLTTYMWQQFGQGYKEFLQLFVDANDDDDEARCRGLSYALITGDRDLERWAKDYIRTRLDIPRKLIAGMNLAAEMLNQHLLAQGLEWRGNDIRRLYPNQVLHLVFPYRYLHGRMAHDTFKKLQPLPGEYNFGGSIVTTSTAGKPRRIHRIIELDPVPGFLGVTGLNKLVIAADMDQVLLSVGETYQRHHLDGSVEPIDGQMEGSRDEENLAKAELRGAPPVLSPGPKLSTPLIKKTKVLLSQQGPSWFFQRLPLHEGANFYRVGGPPSFIAGPYYPQCISCGKTMSFLLQLDSTLPLEDGKALEWGDGGMAYVYWCDACKISAVHFFAS